MSEVASHPITLEQVLFVRSVVISIQGHEFSEVAVKCAPENNLNVSKIGENPKRYQAAMRTQFNQNQDKTYPYSIDMECVGFFTSDDTLTDDEALRGVTITAHNVLYGAIREAVSWITSRQAYGPMVFGLSILRPTVQVAESEVETTPVVK